MTLFGTTERLIDGPLDKWAVALVRHRRDQKRYVADLHDPTYTDWMVFLAGLVGSGAVLSRVKRVNAYVHKAVEYRADEGADTWQAPGRTLARGAGDCEDHAIAKFFGVLMACPGLEVRLVLVNVTDRPRGRQTHAVTVVKIGRTWYVLDCLARLVHKAGRYRNYVATASMDEEHLWAHGPG